MSGLRMDGTRRPTRNAATPAKLAKQWFLDNPRNRVVFHWRWNELSAASKENMGGARDSKVIGKRVIFGPHQSEMSLDGLVSADISTGNLVIEFGPGHTGRHMEYAACK